ncbi:MAG TPA: hypothetical protein C5S50_02675 [Methanosarcinaceae archaeon]|nr:hypothetical protein [Methanosarcinaceae archaeon]
MEELLNKTQELKTITDKAHAELSNLLVRYNAKCHELYGERKTEDGADETLIKTLQTMEDELRDISHGINDRIENIETDIKELTEYINDADLSGYRIYLINLEHA